MIEVPVPVLIAQRVLLMGLAILVFLALRQLAYLANLGREASGRGGLAIGAEAPAIGYRLIGENEPNGVADRFVPGGGPAILLFADPGCGSCEKALRIVEEATTTARGRGLRVLALTQATPKQVAALEGFRETGLPLGQIEERVASRDYRVSATPFFYAVGADGLIAERGTLASKGDIKRAVRTLSRRRRPDSRSEAEAHVHERR